MTNGKCLKCNHSCGKIDTTGCYKFQMFAVNDRTRGDQNVQGTGKTEFLIIKAKTPKIREIGTLKYDGGTWRGVLHLDILDGNIDPDKEILMELVCSGTGMPSQDSGLAFSAPSVGEQPIRNPSYAQIWPYNTRRSFVGTITFPDTQDFMRVRDRGFTDSTIDGSELLIETSKQTFTNNKYRLRVWGQHEDVGQHQIRMQGTYRAYFYTIINPTPSSSGGQIYNGYRDCPFDSSKTVAKNASTTTIFNTMGLIFSDISNQIYTYITNNPSSISGSFSLPNYNNNKMEILRRDYNLEEVYIRQDFSVSTFKELNISGLDIIEETWNTNTALNGTGTTNGGYTPIPVGDRLDKFPLMKKYKISDLLPNVERFKFSVDGQESDPVLISKTASNYIPYQYSGVFHLDGNGNYVEDILDNPDCLVDRGARERLFQIAGPPSYRENPAFDYYGSTYGLFQYLSRYSVTSITNLPNNNQPTGYLDYTCEFSLTGIGEKDPEVMISDSTKMLNYQVTLEKVSPTFNIWTGKYATKQWLGKIPKLFYQPPTKYSVKIEDLEGVYSKGNGTFTIERKRLTCDYDYFYINPNCSDNLDLIGIYFQNMWAGYSGYNPYAQMYLYFKVDYSEANGHKFYLGKPQLIQSDGTEPPPGLYGLYPSGYQYTNHYNNPIYHIDPVSKYIYKNGVYYGYIPQVSLQIGYTYHPELSGWTAVVPQLSDRYGETIYDYSNITDGPKPRVTVTFLE